MQHISGLLTAPGFLLSVQGNIRFFLGSNPTCRHSRLVTVCTFDFPDWILFNKPPPPPKLKVCKYLEQPFLKNVSLYNHFHVESLQPVKAEQENEAVTKAHL